MPPLYDFSILSMKGPLYEGRIRGLVAPGESGSFGVLARHAPMLAALRVGELDIVDEGDRRRRFAVSGGLLEVTSEGVTVLVEAAEAADQIDEERARTARDRAKERLQAHSSDTDMRRAGAALTRALNRLQVAGKDGSN